MTAGTLSSRVLTQAYLDRIARIDDAGPMLNAVIEISADAIAQADTLDAERAAGRVRGPLHGIPVLLKDNIDVAGLVNSAGSLAMAEHRPGADAFVVAQLRAAGAETDGSIICPAAVNGLVGLKPTVGLVSRTGIIPISISQDTAGPMGRTVADVALLRLAGRDGLLAALDQLSLDAVIAPSTSPAWLTDPVLGDHFVGAGYSVAAVAGTPSLTVPAGEVAGLPVGVTWMGRAWSEADLIGYAYAFEQATQARREPTFSTARKTP